jgi:2-polyprenyl-3-methyl-5-hydroxy-6-metoxy-1,4-benzoquinol methylase
VTETAAGGRTDVRTRLYESYASQHAGEGGAERAALIYRRDIRPHLPSPRRGPVLDLGCGQGALVRLMCADGYGAEGVDTSPEQVRLAHATGTGQVSQGDYRDTLTGRPGHYAAVTATDVLEHLSKPEVLDTFDLVATALVPGGVFIARVPNAVSPLGGHTFYGDFTHEAAFTARSVRQLAAAAGFDSVTVRPCPPPAHGMVSAARLVAWSAISAWYRLALAAETGMVRGHILTQNLTFTARTASAGPPRGR